MDDGRGRGTREPEAPLLGLPSTLRTYKVLQAGPSSGWKKIAQGLCRDRPGGWEGEKGEKGEGWHLDQVAATPQLDAYAAS